jgi:hypothetical protein
MGGNAGFEGYFAELIHAAAGGSHLEFLALKFGGLAAT